MAALLVKNFPSLWKGKQLCGCSFPKCARPSTAHELRLEREDTSWKGRERWATSRLNRLSLYVRILKPHDAEPYAQPRSFVRWTLSDKAAQRRLALRYTDSQYDRMPEIEDDWASSVNRVPMDPANGKPWRRLTH